MTVIVYGKQNCVPCTSTKRFLDEHAVPYVFHSIDQDEEALMKATTYGFRSLPIVTTGTDAWSGYNAEKLAALV